MEPVSSGDHVQWETRRRRSGIDFDDVFGGPPRRSSLSSRRSAEDNPPPVGRDPWGRPCTSASFREKPVFGELHSPSSLRRTELGDDFFSDIFRGGGDSECSTPRRFHRDSHTSAHTSAPVSRPLSPSHRHPRPDPPAGASFVLSPPSVTQKVEETRGGSFRDHTQSRGEDGASHVGIHTASIVNGVSVSQADAKTAPRSSLSLGELLFQKFHSEDQSSLQVDDSVSISLETGVDENQTNVKDTGGIDHFHFSMHKWASKGVMLVVPPNPNQRIKNGGRLNGVPVPFLHGVDLPLNKKGLPSGDRVFTSEFGRVDNAVPEKRKSTAKISEARTKVQDADTIHFPSDQMLENGMAVESQFPVSDIEEEKDTRSDGASKAPHTSKKEVSTSHEYHIVGKGHKLENEIEDSMQQTALVRSAEDPVERNQAAKMTMIGPSGAAERHLGYNMPSDITRGKVKDFIKIFDQDVSSKPMMKFVGPPSRSTKTEDTEKTTKEDDEDEILPNVPLIKDPVREQNLHFDPSAEVQRIHRCSSDNNGTTIPSVESILDNVEVLNGEAEEPYFELEECTVEEVVFQLEDQGDFLPTVPNVEEFQNSDAKIREWSAGKEGNIRSLLSTLQYVLWPGSGWKVVPLVELIENSSVRKAYQRALLCLHPDKLQQRGAPEHQKYIAGKVFDTLQEAWDQFGSVGLF